MQRHQNLNTRVVLLGIVSSMVFVLISSNTISVEKGNIPLSPNEMGSVMVLMWHDILSPESEWSRTPENFEKDLAALYEQNFRPISLDDLVNGRISLPKGTSPVVLTFDDATLNQFNILTENGSLVPDPRSAVGILERFHAEHPDFPLEATFFLNGKTPFKEPEHLAFKLNYIVSRGMDIGNHTTQHQNLRLPENETAARIQVAIGGQADYLEGILQHEHSTYRVNTFALCFGQRPKLPLLIKYLQRGTFNGRSYENVAVLNVGASPAPSPFSKKFKPLSLPRVRASESHTQGTGIYDWLKRYKRHPDKRFVSDGDPLTVTFPAVYRPDLDMNRLRGGTVVVY